MPKKQTRLKHRLSGTILASLVLLVVAVFVVSVVRPATANAAAGINHQINFQGKLVNTNGTNVTDGSYSIVFSIYTQQAPGGSNIWTETQSVTTVSGIFQVNLGSVTSLPGSVDFNTDNIYLGIKVGADAEMTPRIQFTAVPQAFNSEKLGGLDKTGFIQNGTGSQTASFNVSGTGQVGTSLTTPILQSAAAAALTITGNAASTWSTSAGNITLQAGSGTISLGSTTNLNSSGGLTVTGGSTLDLRSTTTSAISLDSGTTGGVNIGTNANAKTITIGNATGATSVVLNCGTGPCTVGSNATDHSTTVGSTTGTSVTILQAGTGGVAIGNGGVANTIQIGNTTNAVAQTINIGNNATGGSTSNVLIGSTVAGTTTLQNSSTINLNAGTVVGNATTQNVFNSTATTVNFAGAANTLTVGAAAGTTTLNSNTITATGLTFGGASAAAVKAASGQTLSLQGSTSGSGLTVNSTGSIGIGTTTPQSQIEVKGTTGVSSGAVTMTASSGSGSFTTSASITLSRGDYVVPTTSTGQAFTVGIGGSGTTFTAAFNFTANVTGETFTIYKPTANFTDSSGTSQLLIQGGAGGVAIGNYISSPPGSPAKLSVGGNLAVNGQIYATSLYNFTNSNNAQLNLATGGAVVSRNIADANPAFAILQQNASSTGNLLNLANSGGTVSSFSQNGTLNTTGVIATFNTVNSTNSNTAASPVFTSAYNVNLSGSVNNNGTYNTDNGIYFNNVTPTTGNVFYGINFGTGYNDLLRYNNATTVINGLGQLNLAQTTGTLAANVGGTGQSSYAIGDLLYANTTSTLGKLAAVASGSCLISQGTNTAPIWGACGAGGLTAVGTYSTTNTNANGATVSGSNIIFQDASASAPGMVGTGTQTFAGNKTFTGNLTVGSTGFSAGSSVYVQRVKHTGAGGDSYLDFGDFGGTSIYDPNEIDLSGSTVVVSNGLTDQGGLSVAAAASFTGAPTASATSSLLRVGSAIAGGNAVANGGTYLGLNAPNAGAGSAADFLNFQKNGTSKLKVDNAGSITATGTYNSNAFDSAQLTFGAASSATIQSANNQGLTVQGQGLGALTLGSNSNISISSPGITLGTSGSTINILGVNDFQKVGTGIILSGGVSNTATQSLLQVGSAIVGGNAVANGGTYLGLNAPNTGAGSAADFLNFQKNGSYKIKIANDGSVDSVTGFKLNGTAGVTTTCSGGQLLQNQVVQGGITTGGTCVAGGGVSLAPAAAQVDSSTNSSIFINKTGASGNLLQLQKGGVDVLRVDAAASQTILRGINSDSTQGAELITSNNFTTANWTTTGWTTNTTSATHTTGNTTALTTAQFAVSSGVIYQVTYTIAGNTTLTNTLTPSIGGVPALAMGDNTTHSVLIKTTGTGNLTFTPSTNFNGTISAVSVKVVTVSNAALVVQNSAGTASLEVRTSTGQGNQFVGVQSGQSNFGGNYNTGNGSNSLQNNTTGSFNAATGSYSLQYNTTGSGNTANGAYSLQSNTTGGNNTAVGSSSLSSNTTGSSNTATGANSLTNNTTGSYNTASGVFSLQSNTTGIYNSGYGNYSLQGNTSGNYNSAFGIFTLNSNTTGYSNTAIGDNGLQNNTTGYYNTAVGESSLYNNTTGASNTAVGNNALRYNTTGSHNTALGENAGTQDINGTFKTLATLQNATAIGAFAQVQASNTLALGSVDYGTQVVVGATEGIGSNIFGVMPVDLNSNSITASQSNGSGTITASGAIFSAAKVGEVLIWADGTQETITGYTDSTHVTGSSTTTVETTQYFRTHYTGLQVTNGGAVSVGNGLTVTGSTGINFNNVAGPTTVLTATATSGGTNLNGGYSYVVSYVTAGGETEVGPIVYATAVNQRMSLTNIPISPSSLVTARRIYRSPVYDSYHFKLLTTINDNTTTSYIDNTTDALLGASPPGLSYNALKVTTNGVGTLVADSLSTGVGINALASSTGIENTAVGGYALQNASGYYNSALGFFALASTTTGYENLALGGMAGYSNTTGNNNTVVGIRAGYLNSTGSGNVFLGNYAGYSETGSNKLYIANSSTATPLIGGDFSASTIALNGATTISATNASAFKIQNAGATQTLLSANTSTATLTVTGSNTISSYSATTSPAPYVVSGSQNPAGGVGTTLTASTGSDTKTGDLVILNLYVEPFHEGASDASYGTITPPAGYTLATGYPKNTDDYCITVCQTHRQYIYYGYASTNGAQAVNFSSTVSEGFWGISTTSIRGGPTSGSPFADTPVSAVTLHDATNVTSTPAVSLTTAGSNSLVLWAATDWDGTNTGRPGGFAPSDNTKDGTSGASEPFTSASVFPAAGNTGAIVSPRSGNDHGMIASLLSFRGSAAPSDSINALTVTNYSGSQQILNVDTSNKVLTLNGSLAFTGVAAPLTGISATVGAAGNLSGTYTYRVAYVTANGSTELGPISNYITVTSKQVGLANIPVSPSSLVTARKIYRTTGSNPYNYYLVSTINDNVSTTTTDNTADIGLGASANQNNYSGANISNNGANVLHVDTNSLSLGTNALLTNTGMYNTAIGNFSLQANSGGYNTALGYGSLASTTSGGFNVGLGERSGAQNNGSSNVFLGSEAGYLNTTGSGNVFIGNYAGYNETASNKLYIANNTGTPLIGGDFSASTIALNGATTVKPISDNAAAFNVQNAAGLKSLLNVDTLNNKVTSQGSTVLLSYDSAARVTPTVIGGTSGLNQGSNNTTYSITTYGGTQIGDLVMVSVYMEPANEASGTATYGTITAPGSLTLVPGYPKNTDDSTITTTKTHRQYVYYYYATANGTQTLNFSSTSSIYWEAASTTIRGGPTSGSPFADTPVSATTSQGASGVTATPSVSLNLSGNNSLVMWVNTDWAGNASGGNPNYFNTSAVGPGGNIYQPMMAYKTFASSGSTGALTAPRSGNDFGMITSLFSIRGGTPTAGDSNNALTVNSYGGSQIFNVDTTNKILTMNGDGYFGNTSLTAFQIQNSAGTSNTFMVDTQNGCVSILVANCSSNGYALTAAGVIGGTTLRATGNIVIDNSTLTDGGITKQYPSTGTITFGDVVIMNSSGQAQRTTTAHDQRVLGIVTYAGTNAIVALNGNAMVNADTGAINVGDQLVSSTTAGMVTADNTATTGILGYAATSKTAGSNGTVGVNIHTQNGQYAPKFQNASDSALAFQIQNAGNLNIFTANTLNKIIQIGSATTDANAVVLSLDSYNNATDPSGASAVAGAMYYNSATGNFRCYTAGAWNDCASGALYSATADGTTITGATTTLQNLSNTYTMPASYCTAGRVIHIYAAGLYSTTTTAQSIAYTIKLGATAISSATSAITPSASQTNLPWVIDYNFTCRAAPSAASAVYGQGNAMVQTVAGTTNAQLFVPAATAGTNIATNATQAITIGVTLAGTASASNTLTLKQMYVNPY